MQNRLTPAGVLLAALLVPALVLAQNATPTAVTGVQASFDDGKVTVTWDPAPEEEPVSYYRIYYSSESILDNGGAYDDFEATPDASNSYALEYTPVSRTLYVAVLAVNAQGAEGDVFVEEAAVMTDNGAPQAGEPGAQPSLQYVSPRTDQQLSQSSQSSSPATFNVAARGDRRETEEEVQERRERIARQADDLPEWEEQDLGGAMHLLLTDVISPTKIQLLFSVTPTVEPERAPEAFSIRDADDNPLRIESVLIDQEVVVVNTAIQTRGTVYEIRLSEPLRGAGGEPLDATNRSAFFQGHGGGNEPETATETPPETRTDTPAPAIPSQPTEEWVANPPAIRNLTLSTSSRLDGNYTVHARWDIENPFGDLVQYAVRQSLDGGETFNEPQVLPLTVDGVDIPGTRAGEFGVGITVINIYGYQSEEVFRTIRVGPQDPPEPPEAPPPQETTADVTPPQGTETIDEPIEVTPAETADAGHLAQSGAGLALGLLGITGVAAGWRMKRKAV